MTATETAPVATGLLLEEARDALAIAEDRAEAAEAKVAGYESAITWATSCIACARVLDSCIAETERRVLAEDALAAERERADAAVAEVSALGGRLGDAIRSAVKTERGRAETAEARIAEAREVIGNFLGEYGESEIGMFKVAQDLANSIRKILGGPDD